MGQEIEADWPSKYPGVPEPGVLWRQRRWRYLLNLIERLPAHSHMHAALANDPEWARMVQEREKEREKAGVKSRPSGPSLVEWTPVVEALASVNDRLAALIESNKKKPGKVKPYTRPRTAFNDLEQLETERVHDSLVAALIPGDAA